MSKDGQLTSTTAESIRLEYSKKGYDVYSDHGEPGPFVGTIVSSIGEAPAMGEELSQLDIAIIGKSTRHAVALIEIEETTDTPKTILGDIFGILMGESVTFSGNSNGWKIGNWTTLIIIGEGKDHEKRNGHIRDMALRARSAFGTANSKIGDIVIKSFSGHVELKSMLMDQIEQALQGSA